MPLTRTIVLGTVAASLLVSSCAANPATGRQSFSLVGEKQEYQMGQQTAEQEIKSAGIYNNLPNLTTYVRELAQRMWTQTERAGTPVQVNILDSEVFNAWAVPGYVSFYRGILPYFQNETQLAEVMGHEMGHITARHSAQGLTRGTLGSLALTAGGLILAATTDNQALANVVTTVGTVGVGLGLTAYGRGDELEADRLALRYMGKAGYDAREAYNSHKTFELYEDYSRQQYAALNNGQVPAKGVLGNLTSTHPQTPDRAAQVQQLVGLPDGSVKLPAGVTPATPQSDPLGRTRYLRAIDGLDYGPKRDFGIAGRNVVYLPKQRFIWRLPDSSAGGFVADVVVKDKTTFVWKAANQQAGVKANLTFVPLENGVSPVQKLMSLFTDLSPRSAWQQDKVRGGESAWTTTVTNQGGALVRIAGVAIPGKKLMAVMRYEIPNGQQAADGALLAAMRKGGVLTELEASNLKTLKVRIRTSAGEPVATMAAKMPAGGLQEAWFRALNGLQPGQTLPTGMLYKTVVDENNL